QQIATGFSAKLERMLEEEGFEFVTESRLYSVPIDILATDGEETVSVELKTKDFKRGIQQAERNQTLVDYSYLSVWEEYVTGDLVDRIDHTGIGLLSVGNHVKCLSTPAKNETSDHATSRINESILPDVRK
ncbi:hypothetical protein PNQ92_12900, partial [Halobacterium salinarum]|uniref:hypothetical protein n=1 Tax=Halobacterium salinarum TaxID=2242 RepID=UPI002557536D